MENEVETNCQSTSGLPKNSMKAVMEEFKENTYEIVESESMLKDLDIALYGLSSFHVKFQDPKVSEIIDEIEALKDVIFSDKRELISQSVKVSMELVKLEDINSRSLGGC